MRATDGRVTIAFDVTNFELRPPGSCGDTPRCGHAHLTIDGDACNLAGSPYNAATALPSVDADLTRCPVVAGPHTFRIELRGDDHSPLSPPVSATVATTVEVPETPPTVTIATPAMNDAVTPSGTPPRVPITFAVAGFTLMAPNTCMGAPRCGHVHLSIAETGCNRGRAYNTMGASTTINGDLSGCESQTGAHTFTVELRNDNHSAMTPPIATSVTITVNPM
jgi:hypothetical protein